MLDDWATPLDAYVRALRDADRRVSSRRVRSRRRFAVAKACSFVLNLLALPALYGFARRRFGPRVALGAMAVLAVLPVHAIYAGFVLRESLVVLTSILAVWTLTEVWQAESRRARRAWAWPALAGLCGGLAILARNTALALLAAAGPRLRWSITAGAGSADLAAGLGACDRAWSILPWAVATYRRIRPPVLLVYVLL